MDSENAEATQERRCSRNNRRCFIIEGYSNNSKSANRLRYYKMQKEKQRSLLQQQYEDKWKTHLLNVEYMQWAINTKMENPIKSV